MTKDAAARRDRAMSGAILRAAAAAGVACALSLFITPAVSTHAEAQASGGFTGHRGHLGPRYEPYPERMWESYTRTGTCPPVEVRTRLPNGRVAVRRIPWNPQACGFNTLE
jgi:hypothetical protein